MESVLLKKKCVPCEGGIPKLKHDEILAYHDKLKRGWVIVDDKMIQKTFNFVSYKHTMSFVSNVAELADIEGHHPVMHVHYGKVVVDLWTFAIDGLSENDFILAAKIDEVV